jgi:hypothetical protein
VGKAGRKDTPGLALLREIADHLREIAFQLSVLNGPRRSGISLMRPAAAKQSAKQWVPDAFKRRPDELLAMGISKASRELATESGKFGPGTVENKLREMKVFEKKRRQPVRQRPR